MRLFLLITPWKLGSVCTHFLEDPVALNSDILFWELELVSAAPASPQAARWLS